MDNFREVKNTLTWHHASDGTFEAELINGQITKLNFCEPGKGAGDCGKCLTSIDFKFLVAVHTSLGELFKAIEEENKRMGYTYANEKAIETTIDLNLNQTV